MEKQKLKKPSLKDKIKIFSQGYGYVLWENGDVERRDKCALPKVGDYIVNIWGKFYMYQCVGVSPYPFELSEISKFKCKKSLGEKTNER